MVPGIIGPTNLCMSAMQANSAPLNQGGNLLLNETQVRGPLVQIEYSRIDLSRPMSDRRD